MNKKLVRISGAPFAGKTTVGTRLFERCGISAYPDGAMDIPR